MDFEIIQLLGPLYELTKKLLEVKISVNKNITIDYQRKQIQYDVHIILESDQTKRTNFAKVVQSYFKEPLRFENVLDHSWTIVPNASSSLEEPGLVILQGNRLSIDFGKLIKEVNFDIFSIRITCSTSQDFLGHFIIPTEASTGKGENNRIKTHLEVSLDYLSSWLKFYDRFEAQRTF
jgi:hypothetical protein